MNSELKDIKVRIEETRENLREAQDLLESMTARHDELTSSIPDQRQAVVRSESLKHEALEAYTLNQISEAELNEARRAVDNAKRTEIETLELQEATERQTKQLSQRIPDLKNKVAIIERRYWKIKGQDKKTALHKKIRGDVIEIIALERLCGAFNYDSTCREICGPLSTGEEMKALQKQLKADHGI